MNKPDRYPLLMSLALAVVVSLALWGLIAFAFQAATGWPS